MTATPPLPDRPLDPADLDPDPVLQFERWLADARAASLPLPEAMTLATAGADGTPSARMVLLRGLDARGFVFFTHYASAKARDLDANPRAALVFHWPLLERQVRVAGPVERVARDESAAYFATRPRGSRVAAWASPQSQVIPDRQALEARVAAVESEFPEGGAVDVPLPPFWGGYRVRPLSVEFWRGRPSRLHDRLRYQRLDGPGGGWRVERLAP